MLNAHIFIALAASLAGAGASYLFWAGLRHLRHARDTGPVVAGDARKPSHLERPPPHLDASALVDTLRADIATIANAQISLLNEQAAREGRFLAEMRAVAAAPDPEILARLRRIEALLTGEHDEDPEGEGEADPDAPVRKIPMPADARLVNIRDHTKAGGEPA